MIFFKLLHYAMKCLHWWIWLAEAGGCRRTVNWRIVTDNEKNVISEESDSEESVIQFNSKQIDDILNKVNDLQNLRVSMDTEKIPKAHWKKGAHKNSKSQSLITDYISCDKKKQLNFLKTRWCSTL